MTNLLLSIAVACRYINSGNVFLLPSLCENDLGMFAHLVAMAALLDIKLEETFIMMNDFDVLYLPPSPMVGCQWWLCTAAVCALAVISNNLPKLDVAPPTGLSTSHEPCTARLGHVDVHTCVY